jgi:hypothetical protein
MLLSLRSKILSHDRDFEGALRDAEASLARDPAFAEARFHKALALAGLGRREEAMASLALAKASDPRLGEVFRRAEQLPDAADLFLLLGGEGALRPPPSPSSGRRPDLLTLALATLGGGLLVALGLFSALAGPWGRRVKGAVTDMTRRRRPAAPAAREIRPGDLLGGTYRVTREIGVGGMGVVFEAVDQTLERKVAVKKMRPEIRADARESARFLQEAKVVAALRHPNIVAIYAIVEEGSDAFLVFEFVDGKTVHEMMAERGRLSLPEAVSVLRGACAALDFAHRKNVIHRDLKPSNIMVARDGAVKVMDFGVARQSKDSLSRLSITNTVVGTPPYMAPEAEQGAVCKESDVFGLAASFYEMLTGELPFSGAGAGMLACKMNRAYAPLSRLAPGLPPGLDAVLAGGLEPDPSRRIRAAGEFLKRIEAIA